MAVYLLKIDILLVWLRPMAGVTVYDTCRYLFFFKNHISDSLISNGSPQLTRMGISSKKEKKTDREV